MGPEDGDPPRKRARTPSRSSDAFAATIAPAAAPAPTEPGPASEQPTLPVPDPEIPGMAGGLPEVASELYRTERELARGGMGRIVAALDQRLGRPVALKQLLEPVGQQVARFEREALITARLQHPGIVPVYEAGRWPTGEPFFAMKLVSGRPLDKVIAEAGTLEDRLALLPRLAAACDAIAYAHSQRIIHRDLKPGNVLIGDFGETVVIDWGLAKDLDAADTLDPGNRVPAPPARRPTTSGGSSLLTVAGAVLGTPAYMAPEQARGEAVDQRADVFALGAMLYHLLAGIPPYHARSASDVIAAAATGDFEPLAERERRAPRDLVAIVDRAMAPLAAERYPHAGELADELRRFLTGQLVDAHRYTPLQRVGRFVRRHRAAVTIAAIALAAFAAGGTLAVTRIVHARDRARAEEAIANTRKRAAERLIDYMFTHVKRQLTSIGRLDLMASLGAEVQHYYDTLAEIPGGMPVEDEIRMAEAIELIGRAQRTSGKADEALATWRGERAKLEHMVGADRSARTLRLRRMIAKLDHESGEIFQERGQVATAIALYTAAKREYERLHDEAPAARDLLLGAADTHDRLGDLLRTEGKVDEAFQEYLVAKSERERASSMGTGMVSVEVLALSTSHLKVGSIYQNRGDSKTALAEYKTALRLRETLLESHPDDVRLQEKVLEVQSELAALERSTGDDRGATETYERALPVSEALLRRDPTNTDWQRQRGDLLADLGFALTERGELPRALEQLDEAIELQKQLVARDPKSSRYRVDLSRSYTRSGDALVDLGKTGEGIERYKLALAIRRELLAQDPHSVPYRRSFAWSHAKLAGAYTISGDLPHALVEHEQALAIRRQLVAEAHAQGAFRDELASTEVALGALLAARDPARSERLIRDGLARAHALADGDPINNDWKLTLTQGLLAEATRAGAAHDAKARAAALAQALEVVGEAAQRAPDNVQWPGLAAEAHAGLAELAAQRGDAKAAGEEWGQARAVLEPLAKAGRLPAPRMALLARARARR